MIQFDTGMWIWNHSGKWNLSQSGMYGRVDLSPYFERASMMTEDELKSLIANINGADVQNIVITHGATEALFMTLCSLKAQGIKKAKFVTPEYEPLIKVPEFLGYSLGSEDINIYSNPNNPTGTFSELAISSGIHVVDETFMQFHNDLDSVKNPELTYRINTFTKFYGGDDLRVGYIIAPSREEAKKLDGLKGIFTEPVSKYNISVAAAILKDNDRIKGSVRSIAHENHNILVKNRGKLKFYKGKEPLIGTVALADYSEYTQHPSTEVATLLSEKGISIVPGEIFGINGTYLRVCYSREDFAESYSALIEALESIQ